MAKDPAFLFYSSDFLTGTNFFTDEQVGKYIRLLCYQHQSGKLKKRQVLSVLKEWDLDIMEKFTEEKGLYFHPRLLIETERRALYTQSRRDNLHMKHHMVKHMETETETETTTKRTNRAKFKKPTIKEISAYCKERKNHIDPETFFNHYEANGWMRGKTKIVNWKACVHTWEKNRDKPEPKHGVLDAQKTKKYLEGMK